jgi:hypothetical protein
MSRASTTPDDGEARALALRPGVLEQFVYQNAPRVSFERAAR